jgi:hypothetical protein
MSVPCECCVLSGSGLCVGLITRPEESYREWCVWVWPWSLNDEDALAHKGLLCHGKKNTYSFHFAGLKIFMKDYNRLHARRRYQEMPYDCGASVAKYLLCLFNFVFFVSMLSFDTCCLQSIPRLNVIIPKTWAYCRLQHVVNVSSIKVNVKQKLMKFSCIFKILSNNYHCSIINSSGAMSNLQW